MQSWRNGCDYVCDAGKSNSFIGEEFRFVKLLEESHRVRRRRWRKKLKWKVKVKKVLQLKVRKRKKKTFKNVQEGFVAEGEISKKVPKGSAVEGEKEEEENSRNVQEGFVVEGETSNTVWEGSAVEGEKAEKNSKNIQEGSATEGETSEVPGGSAEYNENDALCVDVIIKITEDERIKEETYSISSFQLVVFNGIYFFFNPLIFCYLYHNIDTNIIVFLIRLVVFSCTFSS